MKKLLLLFCLSTTCLTTFAQNDYDVNINKLTFAIKDGLNLSDISRSVVSSGSASTSPVVSLDIGGFIDYKLPANFSLQLGIYYEGNGGNNKTTSGDGSITSNTKTYLYYLQFPLDLVYHVHTGDNFFYFGAGPYLAYGLRGKVMGNITNTTSGAKPTELDQVLNFGSSANDDLNRFDFGADIFAGYQIENGFFVRVSFDQGLANIYHTNAFADQGITSKAKNQVLCISAGLNF